MQTLSKFAVVPVQAGAGDSPAVRPIRSVDPQSHRSKQADVESYWKHRAVDDGSFFQSAIMPSLKENILVHMIILGTYLSLGLILNALQAICYCIIRPFSVPLFRKINKRLTYAHWAPVTALGLWWSESECRVWCQDEETAQTFGKEHSYLVMNHTYEVDFLYCWILFDLLGVLGTSKSVVKKMLAYVPIFGWNCCFGDQIFLERNWEKDKETLPGKLDTLLTYEDTMLLTMFCEGTRFTSKKHKASVKFAEERGLPILKHHLLPRSKGFILCAKHFHDKLTYMYDVELCMPKDQPNPICITSVLRGKPIYADLYVRRFAFKDLPKDEEGLTKFLYKLYEEKDAIMDYYHTHKNTFPEGCVRLPLQRPPHRLHLYLTAMGTFTGCFAYWALNAFWLSPSISQMIAVSSITGLLYGAMHYLVGLTISDQGSVYGSTHAILEGKSRESVGVSAAASSSSGGNGSASTASKQD